MAVALLIRHGHSSANGSGILAGRTPGVHLTDRGREQVISLGAALSAVPLARVVSSPLERCQETAAALVAGRDPAITVHTDERLNEAAYGAWTGRSLSELVKEELWPAIQSRPTSVTFPDSESYAGESILQMGHRSLAAILSHDAEVEAQHGPDAVWAAVTHGDIVKVLVTDAMGAHWDQLQRVVAEPASVAVIRHTSVRSFVLGLNADPARVASLLASTGHGRDGSATPGGSAGQGVEESG